VWLKDCPPLRFGEPDNPDSGSCRANALTKYRTQAIVVQLDPGLGLGTGTHPSTALCLSWIADQDLEGKNILDYGCGSGILAIAALKRGAARAVCADIDPQALDRRARQRGPSNGVAGRLVRSALDPIFIRFRPTSCSQTFSPIRCASWRRCWRRASSQGDRSSSPACWKISRWKCWRPISRGFDFEPVALTDGWARLSGRCACRP